MANFNKQPHLFLGNLKMEVATHSSTSTTSTSHINSSVSTSIIGSYTSKKMKSFKKLSTKKTKHALVPEKQEPYKYLLRDEDAREELSTPTGYFAVYVGEERRRFVVRTSFLSHPLFRMLLERAADEFGFKQSSGLVVPCSVLAFQEVVNSVKCCNRKFEFGGLVDEFL